MNQRSHTGWLTDMTECIAMLETSNARFTERIIELEADLAAAQSYATTLAVSMHRQHYAEAAPNWQPLPDLVGLLTQIDNMYAGLRNDFEAAQVENKRLVGMNLATLREELAAAQAERDALVLDIARHIQIVAHAEIERDEARAEVAALRNLVEEAEAVLSNDICELGVQEQIAYTNELRQRMRAAIEARKEDEK